MQRTTTSLEISAEEFRAIELEPIGHLLPSDGGNKNHRKTDVAPRAAAESSEPLTNGAGNTISKRSASLIIGTIACIELLESMLGGILIVSLPTMAREINLSGSLLLWPASVNALACGCTLLVSGSITDVVGSRRMFLIGEFFLIATTLACGLCRTGIELILFRAFQGVALSMCFPSSVSLITKLIPSGSWRNVAFACLGAGQPVGFSVGLVLGGVFVDTIGWRWGYYSGAILNAVIFIVSIYSIPAEKNAVSQSLAIIFKRIRTEIDWTGCLLLSVSLGLFSYVFSVMAAGGSHFLEPASLTLFSIAVVLLPLFAFHVRRQERLGKKAMIPPTLWNNLVFTSLCLTVFVVWGVFGALQYFLTLFYQSVQGLSALQTSIRFLPMVVTGTSTNILTGWLVRRVRADVLVLTSASISSAAPLLMAFINPAWSYWTCAFFATACVPICADVLFTVANLVVTAIFPKESHSLAGGVFSTVSNIGESVGLAVAAVVASSVTMAKEEHGVDTKEAVLDGYRVTFWMCFGVNILTLVIVALGLRKIGKVGIKED